MSDSCSNSPLSWNWAILDRHSIKRKNAIRKLIRREIVLLMNGGAIIDQETPDKWMFVAVPKWNSLIKLHSTIQGMVCFYGHLVENIVTDGGQRNSYILRWIS